MRIVSLVPSLTEMLFDFDLQDQLIGRTRFCKRPANKVKGIPVIGGTKNPNIDKIKLLQPDFVLANKEENRKEDIEELQSIAQVYVTDIKTVDDAMASIHQLGKVLEREKQAEKILTDIKAEIENISSAKPVSAAYFIWRNPWMSIGGDTYISDVMRRWGLVNVFASEQRYPQVNLEELKGAAPEYILLSSEPFPFKQKHVQEMREIFPGSNVVLVDGQVFSWYGSRMAEAFHSLNQWRKNVRGRTIHLIP
ncbi:MAG: helical backbone metal receptor [Balneolales bacterium]